MWDIQEERAFWTEFIELYRENTCLWKVGSKEYTDRKKKSAGYDILTNKLKERDAAANREVVTKKINNIRSSFRKEYKKVVNSLMSGAVGEDVYQPNLWYYDLLLFLKDEDIPGSPGHIDMKQAYIKVETAESDDDDDNDKTNLRPGSSLSDRSQGSQLTPPDKKPRMSAPPTTNFGADFTFTPSTSVMMNPTLGTRPSTSMNSVGLPGPSINMNSTYGLGADNIMLLPLIGERIALPRGEDEFEVVGKNVTIKLRKLPENMQIYAEKLINDVLYQAQIGSLTADTKLTT